MSFLLGQVQGTEKCRGECSCSCWRLASRHSADPAPKDVGAWVTRGRIETAGLQRTQRQKAPWLQRGLFHMPNVQVPALAALSGIRLLAVDLGMLEPSGS